MKRTGFSIEVFPPKVNAGIETIYAPLDGLAKLKPDYISVTFSASGSANGLTGEVCEFIRAVHRTESVAHLTCAGNSKEFIKGYLEKLKRTGVNRILALRGDLTAEKILTDYRYATDLIKDIANEGGFGIYAACYPEGHKDSENLDGDIEVMKLKEDLGAEHFISQLFFDVADFFNMVDKARKKGVKGEISAGIMPVTNASQIVRMVQLSGAKIPEKLAKIIAKYEFDKEGLYNAGIDYAVEEARLLISYGVDAVHLYAMNNAVTATKFYDGIKDLLGR